MKASTEQTEQAGWQAQLQLRFSKKSDKTILTDNRHCGPLRVQRPLYPEGEVCHAYILHPPGGVVGGDILLVDVCVEEEAAALITTPGATKFYRSAARPARQHQKLQVRGGCLEWFPQDNIIFPGAVAEISTEIELDGDAHFCGWEVTSLGLPCRQELFLGGSLRSSLSLHRNNRPLLLDSLRIDAAKDLDNSVGLHGYPVTATFLATGVERTMLTELRRLLPPPTAACLAAITLMDGLLVGRYLGGSTCEARTIFTKLWGWLRPVLINRQACPPRIWAT